MRTTRLPILAAVLLALVLGAFAAPSWVAHGVSAAKPPAKTPVATKTPKPTALPRRTATPTTTPTSTPTDMPTDTPTDTPTATPCVPSITAVLTPPSGGYNPDTYTMDASGSYGNCGNPVEYYWSCTLISGSLDLCNSVDVIATDVASFSLPLTSGDDYAITVTVCEPGHGPGPNSICSSAVSELTGLLA